MRLSVLASILSCVLVAGCGAIYTSPSLEVGNGSGLNVRSVEMTPETAMAAANDGYQAQSLPAAYYFEPTFNAPSAQFNTPAPRLTDEVRPSSLTVNPPPQVQFRPYRIGVSDVLSLSIASNDVIRPTTALTPNQVQQFTVQDDGTISVPTLGRVRVEGLGLGEAENALFSAFLENGVDPTFSLEVADFRSQFTMVGGAVRNSGPIPLGLSPVTLKDAILSAGGVTQSSTDYVEIKIQRQGRGYSIPYSSFVNRNDLQNLILTDRDFVYVESLFDETRAQAVLREQLTLQQFENEIDVRNRAIAISDYERAAQRAQTERSTFESRLELGAVNRNDVFITGEVATPRRITMPFEQELTLADVLFDEGGAPTKTADWSNIYVLRLPTSPLDVGSMTAYHLNASNFAHLTTATLFQLRPNDVIYVSAQPITTWNRIVSQVIPSLVTQVTSSLTNQ